MDSSMRLSEAEDAPSARTRWAALLAWNSGRSILWQSLGVVLVWAFLVILHRHNDGLWYQGDSPRHAANGVFWRDFLLHLPVNPLSFALQYFARYPVIAPTIYPPVFYLIEAVVFSVFGISAFVAKGIVLAFALLAGLYMLAWLRYTVSSQVGWGGALLLLQPGVMVWSNAVMLNVPSMALGLATLYHGRQLLDRPRSSQLYPAAAFGVLAILTYLPTAMVLFVLLAWSLVERRGAIFRQRRTWIVAGLAALALAPWAVVTLRWAPAEISMASGTIYHTGAWLTGLWRWLFYLGSLPELFTKWVLTLAAIGAVAGLWSPSWRREAKLALVWFLVLYLGFSCVAVREPRYVLLLGPPLIILSMVALVWAIEQLTAVFGKNLSGATLAGVAAVIGVHLYAAPEVPVPAVRGMRELVAFLDRVAPNQRIFYDGKFDGVFTFYIRAGDRALTQSVTLGNKLLYAIDVDPSLGLVEMVASPSDVIKSFQDKCGCRWVVVESKWEHNEPSAARYLRQAVRGPDFKFVRSFQFDGPPPAPLQLEVYRFLLPIKKPLEQELRFPILGSDKVYRVAPMKH
jgi:dolichyl-phosphate-mannose-protein mannosyltransferase